MANRTYYIFRFFKFLSSSETFSLIWPSLYTKIEIFFLSLSCLVACSLKVKDGSTLLPPYIKYVLFLSYSNLVHNFCMINKFSNCHFIAF